MATKGSETDSTWGNYFKGMLGLDRSANGSGTQDPCQTPPRSAGMHISVDRQDSLPEMVSTPSDVGIWEVSHNEGERFTFSRMFRDPRKDTGAGVKTQEEGK